MSPVTAEDAMVREQEERRTGAQRVSDLALLYPLNFLEAIQQY